MLLTEFREMVWPDGVRAIKGAHRAELCLEYRILLFRSRDSSLFTVEIIQVIVTE